MPVFRLCLKDKSSILIERESLEALHQELETHKFINSRDGELIATEYIWCVRVSSKDINGSKII